MSKRNTTIEINGHRYDAHTGALLSMDGMTKAPAAQPVAAVGKPVATPPKPVQKKSMNDVVRTPAKAASRKTDTAHTLMRHAVKKPGDSLKRTTKVQSNTGALVKNPGMQLGKPLAHSLNDKRLQRAQSVAKSSAINKFHKAPLQPSHVHQFVAPVPTAALPSRPTPIRTAPVQKKSQNSADILQRAIEQATSHQQPAPKVHKISIRKQALALGCTVVVAAGLLGFTAIHNVSGIRMQMAGSKAGFAASKPSYQAPGFHLANTQSSDGVVALRYASNSDERSYTVTQRISDWDSAALLTNFVARASSTHQTQSVGGRTLYTYSDNNAAWVSGGVFYQVQSDGALSGRQLTDLATSL